MVEKKELERLYPAYTNVIICNELKITQTTLLKWLDKYEIPRKGSPQQKRGIGYREILSNWWRCNGKWSRVIDYNGEFFFQGEWVSGGYFYNLKAMKMPKEIK